MYVCQQLPFNKRISDHFEHRFWFYFACKTGGEEKGTSKTKGLDPF